MAMEQALATGLHRMMHCTELAELASGAKDPQIAHFLSGHSENEARSLCLHGDPTRIGASACAAQVCWAYQWAAGGCAGDTLT